MIADNLDCHAIVSAAMSTADAQHLHRVAGKASAGEVQLPLDEWSKGLLRKSSRSLQGAFGRTQSPSLGGV
jgi:hypothetical protein